MSTGSGHSGMQKTDGTRGREKKKEKSSACTEFSYHRLITYTGILSVIVFRRYQRQQPIKGLRMASQSILSIEKKFLGQLADTVVGGGQKRHTTYLDVVHCARHLSQSTTQMEQVSAWDGA